ncbi:probable procollagen C-endopeptidase enhancer 1 [Coccomyxa sp. Obi]|nr:probable procollagen C-endopeptidase enhancer 1 [Coccomyxa sp. Obi]
MPGSWITPHGTNGSVRVWKPMVKGSSQPQRRAYCVFAADTSGHNTSLNSPAATTDPDLPLGFSHDAGTGAAGPSPGACNVSYADLAPPAARVCASSLSSSAQQGNFTLRCPACAPVLATPAPAPASAAAEPYCNGTQLLKGAAGVLSDGAPAGGEYAPGSFCQWIIDPGYTPVRLNFTRFDTEEGYDFVYILHLNSNGFQDIVQQLSGALYQVPRSITVPSNRAVVVFTSDQTNQYSGFAVTWDQGNYCQPRTTLVDAQGTVSDGAPAGLRYRPYTHCEWLIAPGYAPISLTFSRFSLAPNDTLTVYDGDTADPARHLAILSGFEVPLSLETSTGDDDHIFQVNGTLTGAMLLVFDVADGSKLGGGFSAFYGPVHSGARVEHGARVGAGDTSGANWGFTRLVSAIIIVCAVIFGLACGTIVGCLLVKLISLQHERRSGGHVRSGPRQRWVRLPRFGHGLRWQRQPSVAQQDVQAALGTLGSGSVQAAAEGSALTASEGGGLGAGSGDDFEIVLVGASRHDMGHLYLRGGGKGCQVEM